MKLKKRKGFALITVLVVLVVMSILLATSFTLLQSNTKQIRSQEENLKAHYLARSGAMLAYTAILDDSGTKLLDQFSTSKFYNETTGKKETIAFTDEKAEAKVNAWYNNGYIIIKSESEIKNPTIKSTIYLKMVLDNSGSMAWNMTGDENSGKWRTIIGDFKVNGVKQEIGKPAKGSSGQMLEINTWYYNSGNNLYRAYYEPMGYNRGYVIKDDLVSRISILKNQAQLLVDQLFTNKIEGDLVLVPFSTKGEPVKNSLKYEFNIRTEGEKIKNEIGKMKANGGTNTGDGLRRAYYLLDDINKNESRRNYLIVLVDGVTTYYSGPKNNFYLENGNNFSVYGNGSRLDADGEKYVNKIGEMIRGAGSYKNHDIKTFVIGFSDKWENGKYSELESVNTIAEACGIGREHHFDINNRNNPLKDNPERVFWARDEKSLQNVFDSISKYIEADFWQVSGPDNK